MKPILVLAAIWCAIFSGFSAASVDTASLQAARKVEASKKTHWITTSSGVRHNSTCRWYQNSKGRSATKDEGRACKVCGG